MGAACDYVQRGCWGAFASKSKYFHWLFKYFWLSLRVPLATMFIVVAGVRLLQNQSVSIGFTSIVGSRYGCCLRLCSSWLLGYVCFKINTFPLYLQALLLSLWVLLATMFIVIARGAFASKSMHWFYKHCWLLL